jgi:hypothetical protein
MVVARDPACCAHDLAALALQILQLGLESLRHPRVLCVFVCVCVCVCVCAPHPKHAARAHPGGRKGGREEGGRGRREGEKRGGNGGGGGEGVCVCVWGGGGGALRRERRTGAGGIRISVEKVSGVETGSVDYEGTSSNRSNATKKRKRVMPTRHAPGTVKTRREQECMQHEMLGGCELLRKIP